MWQATLPSVTNRETWEQTFNLIDSETGEDYDLTGIDAVVFELRDPDTRSIELSASYAAENSTVTMTIASPCVVSWAAHAHSAGQRIRFTTTGALPAGITAGTYYYIISTGLGADSFRFSASLGGSAINTSGSQSGTHTAAAPTEEDGITIEEDGNGSFISVRFETSSMRELCAKSYEFGMVLTKDDDDLEVVGHVYIIDGIVT
jgi:hypothetical protein